MHDSMKMNDEFGRIYNETVAIPQNITPPFRPTYRK
jgi:hypothetical protein